MKQGDRVRIREGVGVPTSHVPILGRELVLVSVSKSRACPDPNCFFETCWIGNVSIPGELGTQYEVTLNALESVPEIADPFCAPCGGFRGHRLGCPVVRLKQGSGG